MVSEKKWEADHAAYIAKAVSARVAYRGLLNRAEVLGWCAFSFNEAVKFELDEDAAGNDPWEWVRAAEFAMVFEVECFSPPVHLAKERWQCELERHELHDDQESVEEPRQFVRDCDAGESLRRVWDSQRAMVSARFAAS